MSVQALILSKHPIASFVGAEFVLTGLALGPAPSVVPLILLLSVARLHAQRSSRRHSRVQEALLSLLSTSVAASLAYVSSASTAVPHPIAAYSTLFVLVGLLPACALLSAVFLDTFFIARIQSPGVSLTLFPTIWAAVLTTVSHYLPWGRLLTWSPVVSSSGPYAWLLPFTGPAGIDFIIGSWAVIGSELAAKWLMGEEAELIQSEPSLIDHDDGPHITEVVISHRPKHQSHNRGSLTLGTALLVLALPSLFTTPRLPHPTHDSLSTPLTVGCVLPSTKKGRFPTLIDYIDESRRLTYAKVLLWPESAVFFDSSEAKDAAFEKIRSVQGPLFGIPFEEIVTDSPDRHKRNGIALVSSSQKPGEEIVQYYKRNLVPIAESFSTIASIDPPTIYTYNLTAPRGTTKPEWSPLPGFTRPIPITSSICFDFASPAAFSALPSRPALILAPARTWDTTVSLAMWEQAKTRAEEIGSVVLWCDGGAHGVSGVGGQGINEVMQVGPGPWTRDVGVPWPFDERRTVYGATGDGEILAFLLAIVMASLGGGAVAVRAGSGVHAIWSVLHPLLGAIPSLRGLLGRVRSVDVEHEGERRPLLN